MKTIVEIPDSLLNEAERISGLGKDDVVVFALKIFVSQHSNNNDRQFGEQFTSFEFWDKPDEDIYNDLIKV